jgi:hypothetical protein
MSVTPSPIGGFAAQFFDNNGVILSGGKIYTYAAGTTTPQASYTSALGITPHANPIILDSAGRVPGGEIWLTDGLVYKFVIETAASILIGTYDNITGVNSNFINYTVQEEVITATAGQTVFDLSTINYTPGTNSLSVYIDGVNQYVGDSYLETDSDTVTFTSGVHVGGEVKFTTAVQTTTGAVDASLVSYTPPFTGSVGTTVEDKLAQYASVEDFGAVGDGVETSPGVWTGTDDTVALQAAAAWFSSTPGAVLTFAEGKNYLIYNRFTIIGASHATINGNGASLIQMSNNHTIFCIPGVSGVSDFSTEPVIDMVGNYDAGATEIVLTSVASIVVGDYLWIRSRQTITPLPATSSRQPVAEIVIVKAKDAGTNTITLEYPISKDYIEDTVNVDPTTGLPYPHGVVLAENFARITAEYLTIDSLNVVDTAGVEKFSVFLWQVFRCNLIDMAVEAGNGFVVRGAFVNMIRLQGKITARGTPSYRGIFAIAPDTGSSHYLIDTPYFWSDNAFPYLHLHEGLSDIEVRGGTFMSATDTPIAFGGGVIIGVCQITGGCWGIRLTGQTFINSPTPVSGLVHGVRVTNNETLMPGGIKGVVIERTKFCGTFNGSALLVDPVTGEGVDVIIPDVTEATSSDPWLISLLAPTCLLFEPRGDFTKIRNNGSRSRTYMRDKMMQLADFTTVGNQGPLITGRQAGQGAPPLWWENTATNNNINAASDASGNLIFNSGGTPGASLGTGVAIIGANSALTTNQDTNFWLLTRIGGVNTLKKVTLDAADSAGVGFRGLRVTN